MNVWIFSARDRFVEKKPALVGIRLHYSLCYRKMISKITFLKRTFLTYFPASSSVHPRETRIILMCEELFVTWDFHAISKFITTNYFVSSYLASFRIGPKIKSCLVTFTCQCYFFCQYRYRAEEGLGFRSSHS